MRCQNKTCPGRKATRHLCDECFLAGSRKLMDHVKAILYG